MLIIDRFEGDYAVCEDDDNQVLIEKKLIDVCAKEGDVLVLVDGLYKTDKIATEERRNKINLMMKDLWK